MKLTRSPDCIVLDDWFQEYFRRKKRSFSRISWFFFSLLFSSLLFVSRKGENDLANSVNYSVSYTRGKNVGWRDVAARPVTRSRLVYPSVGLITLLAQPGFDVILINLFKPLPDKYHLAARPIRVPRGAATIRGLNARV